MCVCGAVSDLPGGGALSNLPGGGAPAAAAARCVRFWLCAIVKICA